jgi:hypothetical protein
MSDIVVSIIVVLVTGVVVAGIFWFTNKAKSKNEEALQHMAESHGWNYKKISERLAWGAQISGNNWELTAESRSIGQASDSGSSNIQQVTRWRSELKAPAVHTIWIGPRLSRNFAAPGSLNSSDLGLFGNAATPVTDLQEIDSGIAELKEKYVIMGDPGMDASSLRTSPIPRILLDWPEKSRPLVKVSSHLIEITIIGFHMEKPEEIEKFVLLGETLISLVQ